MFKPLPSKTTKRTKPSKSESIDIQDVNALLKNRKLSKIVLKENRLSIVLTDGRRIIIKDSSIKVKYNDKYMSPREIKSFNEQVADAIKKMKKDVPRECRSCMDGIDLTP